MDDGVLGRDIALRLATVADDERVVHVVVVTPPPAFHVLEPLEVFLAVRALVPGQGQHECGRLARRRRRARLAQLFGRATVEHLEASDEFALALGAVRAQARVLGVREERDGPDVVRGGPTRRESVGGLVPSTGLELGNATFGMIPGAGGASEPLRTGSATGGEGGREGERTAASGAGHARCRTSLHEGLISNQSALSAFTRVPVLSVSANMLGDGPWNSSRVADFPGSLKTQR